MKMHLQRSLATLAALALLTFAGHVVGAQNPSPGTTLVPAAWYQADVGVLMASGAVTNWVDQSGNGNSAVQTTAANRPTLVAGVLPNGKPTLRFDGTDRLLFRSPLLSQNWTCFTVARPDWDNNQKAFLSGGTGSFEWRIRRNGENPPGRQGVNKRSLVPLANGIALVATNAHSVLSARYAEMLPAADIALRLNRSADGSAHVSATTFTNATTDVGGVSTFRGDIAAMVVFTNALTDVDVESVENYLYNWYTQYPPTVILLR
jgi:hypothetical protein